LQKIFSYILQRYDFFRIFAKKTAKNTTMEYEEITDEISQEVELPEEPTNFDLRDAVIYSTILEQKYN